MLMLEDLFPASSPVPSLVVIFLGANDAALPNRAQHGKANITAHPNIVLSLYPVMSTPPEIVSSPSPFGLLCANTDVCSCLSLYVCVLAEVSEYASNLKAIVHYFRHTFAPPPPLLLLTPPPVIEVNTPHTPYIHTHPCMCP